VSDRQVDLELVRGCQGIEAADVDLVDARFGCAIGEDSIKAVDAFVRVVGDHGLRSSPDLDVGHYARTTEPLLIALTALQRMQQSPDRRFPRSRPTVAAKGMRPISV